MKTRRVFVYCLTAIAVLVSLFFVSCAVLWLQHLHVAHFWHFPWE